MGMVSFAICDAAIEAGADGRVRRAGRGDPCPARASSSRTGPLIRARDDRLATPTRRSRCGCSAARGAARRASATDSTPGRCAAPCVKLNAALAELAALDAPPAARPGRPHGTVELQRRPRRLPGGASRPTSAASSRIGFTRSTARRPPTRRRARGQAPDQRLLPVRAVRAGRRHLGRRPRARRGRAGDRDDRGASPPASRGLVEYEELLAPPRHRGADRPHAAARSSRASASPTRCGTAAWAHGRPSTGSTSAAPPPTPAERDRAQRPQRGGGAARRPRLADAVAPSEPRSAALSPARRA